MESIGRRSRASARAICLAGVLLLPAAGAEPGLRVLLLDDRGDRALTEGIRSILSGDSKLTVVEPGTVTQSGTFQVKVVGPETITQPDTLRYPGGCDVLVLPDASRIPAGMIEPLEGFLRSGGKLVVMGRERPFSRMTRRWGDQWLDPEGIGRMMRGLPSQPLVDFTKDDPSHWGRSTSDLSRPFLHEFTADNEMGRVLHVGFEADSGWETIASRKGFSGFPGGHVLTVLCVRADPNTPRIAVEWIERDESRWIATIEVGPSWEQVVLTPEMFQYWYDNPSRARGGPGDHFRPENAGRISIGISESHTGVKKGRHEFWLGRLATASSPVDITPAEPPRLEGLSPWYKTYRASGLARVTSDGDQALFARGTDLSRAGFPAPESILGPIERNPGLGVEPTRRYRWIPLLNAADGAGRRRGFFAGIFVHSGEPYPRTSWAWIGIPDGRYLEKRRAELAAPIRAIVRALGEDRFLLDAGAEQPCYWAGEAWSLGFRVRNAGRDPAALGVRTTILSAEGAEVESTVRLPRPVAPGKVWREAWEWKPRLVAPGQVWHEAWEWKPGPALSPGVYTVTTELTAGGGPAMDEHAGRDGESEFTEGRPEQDQGDEAVRDRIRQAVRVVPRRKPDPDRLVRVRNGEFVLGGKRWLPWGINYWPLAVSGLESFEYWVHWLRRRFYDPDAVERELTLLESLGMNLVSIQYTDPSMARPLVDFLERCRAHGVKVNIYISGAHPLSPNLETITRLIQAARLSESDAVFAYDLAWEPHLGGDGDRARRALDPHWHDWILEQYGSVESAQGDWGVPAPRGPDGTIVGLPNAMLLDDGPHRVLAAAFRRFLDDAISRGYGRVARHIRSLDPHHLIGARTGYGGTGNPGIDHQIPFDLASGAAHLDFISPEGYGLGPSFERTRIGGLVTAYARLVSGGKPVFWAEYGLSIHPQPDPEKLGEQAVLYESFARMIIESGADGGAGWWWPGGYRVGENSDYGIIGPDGRPRPAALENARWATELAKARVHEPEVFVTADRDLHPRGFSALRGRHREEYVRLAGADIRVALRTLGTGTTSVNCPAIAVGNTTWNGTNPPKFLNAEFWTVEAAMDGDGWKAIEKGGRVQVRPGSTLRMRVEVVNTAEATWIGGEERGTVSLVVTRRDGTGREAGGRATGRREGPRASRSALARIPVANTVPFAAHVSLGPFEMPSNGGDLLLVLEARDRGRFGERFPIGIEEIDRR